MRLAFAIVWAVRFHRIRVLSMAAAGPRSSILTLRIVYPRCLAIIMSLSMSAILCNGGNTVYAVGVLLNCLRQTHSWSIVKMADSMMET